MDPDDQGGDPACWLHQLCAVCGQLIEGPGHPCAAGEAVSPGEDGAATGAASALASEATKELRANR